MRTIRFPLYQTKLYSPRGILAGMARVGAAIRAAALRALDKPRGGLTLKG